ncbi:hypothetical protein EJB05_52657, partial [Eragrostis curvula]
MTSALKSALIQISLRHAFLATRGIDSRAIWQRANARATRRPALLLVGLVPFCSGTSSDLVESVAASESVEVRARFVLTPTSFG